jgi:hypothetical protein
MADLPSSPTANPDTSARPGRGSSTRTQPSTPRWVYVFGIVLLVLVVLFVIQHLAGGGFGPASHMPS